MTAVKTSRAATSPQRLVRENVWNRRILVGIVILYVGGLILAPLAALVVGAFRDGLRAILAALSQPDVLTAFWKSLLISRIVVVFQATFGTVVAWVFVRDRFPGRQFLNGLVDMPFAISPVVVGYMLLLLFGRNGLLAPVLTPLDIQVAFALPGMILATMFVTLPFMIQPRLAQAGLALNDNQAAAPIAEKSRQHVMQVFHLFIAAQLRYGETGDAARRQRLGTTAGYLKNYDGLIKAFDTRGARSSGNHTTPAARGPRY